MVVIIENEKYKAKAISRRKVESQNSWNKTARISCQKLFWQCERGLWHPDEIEITIKCNLRKKRTKYCTYFQRNLGKIAEENEDEKNLMIEAYLKTQICQFNLKEQRRFHDQYDNNLVLVFILFPLDVEHYAIETNQTRKLAISLSERFSRGGYCLKKSLYVDLFLLVRVFERDGRLTVCLVHSCVVSIARLIACTLAVFIILHQTQPSVGNSFAITFRLFSI